MSFFFSLKKNYPIFREKIEKLLKNSTYISQVIIAIVILLGSNSKAISQISKISNGNNYNTNDKFRYITIKTHAGGHFYTGHTLDKELHDGYRSLELRYGWQNNDPNHWTNKYYNGVSYGVGAYAAYIGTPSIMGTPFAVFGFINFPQCKLSGNTTLLTEGSLGITFDSNYYHATKNPKNDAIGSPFSVYVNVGVGFETIISRNVDLLYGIDYTHFSNGRLTVPNYGLNMLGLNLGFKYHYNKSKELKNGIKIERFKKIESSKAPKNIVQRINILTSFGSVQNGFNESPNKKPTKERYYTFSSYLEYQLNFNVKHGIDTGMDLFYDGSLEHLFPKSEDRYLYGYHLGYNYTFGKMLLKLDFGGYLGPNGSKGKESLWTRAALQYQLLDWFKLHLGLKTKQGFTADWAEFGIVFEPFQW